ncbi:hypothetical protein DEO72_LG8g1186 [Vigna unguiculata]|uniref:Uncharacterized protein n=1 Tax=Vigna unguiculata TaxID=3917 RepID=A0A4D6MQZ6_VIGUN|nr:hypothetical protein DEO72_LG8g1186 [Vigna unguiculata]
MREEERETFRMQRRPATLLVAIGAVAGGSDGSGSLRGRDVGAGRSGLSREKKPRVSRLRRWRSWSRASQWCRQWPLVERRRAPEVRLGGGLTDAAVAREKGGGALGVEREREEACLLFQELLGFRLITFVTRDQVSAHFTPCTPIFDTFTLLCIKIGSAWFFSRTPNINYTPASFLGLANLCSAHPHNY